MRHWLIMGCLAAALAWPAAVAALPDDASTQADAVGAQWCGAWRTLAPEGAGVEVAVRPSSPYRIESEHFVVHYPTPSLEEYAQSVRESAEYSYRILVDTLMHMPPPSDGAGGGDERVDIYVRAYPELGGAYGSTVPDTPIRTPYANTFSSWIELVDTMTAVHRSVVTAHEVYHVVQLGYDRNESLSLLEMFSTWFEDRAYDDANWHYYFLRNFFRRSDRGIFIQNYTNVPWAIFLTERHGDGVMEETLRRAGQTPGPNPRGAFDGTLQTLTGRTLTEEFLEFGVWNYFTSLRDDGAHYSEGAHYPGMRCQIRNDCYPLASYASERPPDELAANYFFFDGDRHRGRLRVRIEPSPEATSYLTVIRFSGTARAQTRTRYDPGAPPDSFVVDDWEDCDSLLAIYQIDRGLPKENTVVVSARYEYDAPPAEPWILVLDRDGCRNPFDGESDEFDARTGEEAVLAASLADASEPVIVTDELPSDLSRCRAVYVVGGFGEDGLTVARSELATLTAYMDAGGDVYLESARLGAWVDSVAPGEPELPAFWSRFGCEFQGGMDSLNVTSWQTEAAFGGLAFDYDAGAPDFRVGRLIPVDADVVARDQNGDVRIAMRQDGESTRVVSTVLLGGSVGRASATRAGFVASVRSVFEGDPPVQPPPAPLRLLATFPNPARDFADLRVESPADASAMVHVYDVAGRRVSTQSARLVPGANTVRVATPRSSGVYFVRIDAGGATAHGRFLVLR